MTQTEPAGNAFACSFPPHSQAPAGVCSAYASLRLQNRLVSFSDKTQPHRVVFPGLSLGTPETQCVVEGPVLVDDAFDLALVLVFLIESRDERFGGQQQTGDTSGIGKRRANHFDRIDDPSLEHVDIGA